VQALFLCHLSPPQTCIRGAAAVPVILTCCFFAVNVNCRQPGTRVCVVFLAERYPALTGAIICHQLLQPVFCQQSPDFRFTETVSEMLARQLSAMIKYHQRIHAIAVRQTLNSSFIKQRPCPEYSLFSSGKDCGGHGCASVVLVMTMIGSCSGAVLVKAALSGMNSVP